MRCEEARPCGSADLAPDAMMVGNDISSAPARRAANSISAATSTSVVPGTHDLNRAVEEPGSERNRRADQLEFFVILHHPEPSPPMAGASFKVIEAGRNFVRRFFSATLKCSDSMPMTLLLRAVLRLRENLAQSFQQSFLGNDYLCALHFVVCLRVIANVGDEDAAGVLH